MSRNSGSVGSIDVAPRCLVDDGLGLVEVRLVGGSRGEQLHIRRRRAATPVACISRRRSSVPSTSGWLQVAIDGDRVAPAVGARIGRDPLPRLSSIAVGDLRVIGDADSRGPKRFVAAFARRDLAPESPAENASRASAFGPAPTSPRASRLDRFGHCCGSSVDSLLEGGRRLVILLGVVEGSCQGSRRASTPCAASTKPEAAIASTAAPAPHCPSARAPPVSCKLADQVIVLLGLATACAAATLAGIFAHHRSC